MDSSNNSSHNHKPLKTCDGQGLKYALSAATSWLERNAASINSLNVFPVPDGDTGTNMLLTMRATVEAIANSPEHSAGKVAQSAAHGALMGARGNSGVILSQILRGLARGLEDKETFTGTDLAEALAEASATAYKGVSKPVEGTILTVIREASESARKAAEAENSSIPIVLKAAVDEAHNSVTRTPLLLSVLRDAGVVDAGGMGLLVILEGALRYIQGEAIPVSRTDSPSIVGGYLSNDDSMFSGSIEQGTYGYCTEFIIQGQDLDIDSIRIKIMEIGDSALVVGDKNLARIHVHTSDPGSVLTYGITLGNLRKIKVDNMQEQHQDFLSLKEEQSPRLAIGTIAVVSGDGLKDVFKSLGVSAIVEGGQTMNPSTEQILQAVEGLSAENYIILPNNPNIVLAARQAQSLSERNIFVVPTETVPQGIAALISLSSEHDVVRNVAEMEKAARSIRTASVTTAVKAVNLNGLVVEKGQVIGLAEGRLTTVGDTLHEVIKSLLSKVGAAESELLTVYYGAGVQLPAAQEMLNLIKEQYPEQEVELIAGGQPHYSYIISAE